MGGGSVGGGSVGGGSVGGGSVGGGSVGGGSVGGGTAGGTVQRGGVEQWNLTVGAGHPLSSWDSRLAPIVATDDGVFVAGVDQVSVGGFLEDRGFVGFVSRAGAVGAVPRLGTGRVAAAARAGAAVVYVAWNGALSQMRQLTVGQLSPGGSPMTRASLPSALGDQMLAIRPNGELTGVTTLPASNGMRTFEVRRFSAAGVQTASASFSEPSLNTTAYPISATGEDGTVALSGNTAQFWVFPTTGTGFSRVMPARPSAVGASTGKAMAVTCGGGRCVFHVMSTSGTPLAVNQTNQPTQFDLTRVLELPSGDLLFAGNGRGLVNTWQVVAQRVRLDGSIAWEYRAPEVPGSNAELRAAAASPTGDVYLSYTADLPHLVRLSP